MALVPLLPAAAGYAGWPAFGYIDLALVPLTAIWLVGRAEARHRVPAPWPLPLWPWHLLIATVVGATCTGLLAEHRLDSPVFISILRTHLPDLLRPMDQATHPLQPLRIALTFIEGWLVFLVVADLCRRAPDARARAGAALAGWISGMVFVCGFALVQYATRFKLHPYWVKANPNIVRSHATLDDPNALGAYLVLGLGIVIGWWYLGRTRRRWAAALFAVTCAGLLTTMSRAAIGAAVLGPVVVLAFLPRPATAGQRLIRRTARIAIAALVAVLLVSGAYRLATTERTRTQPTNQAELVLKTFDPRESSDWVLRGRLPWWKAAAGMFTDAPLTGVGLGRFPRLLADYGGGRSRENAHNLQLQMLAEAGLPGGVAFAVFCVALCTSFVRKVRDGVDEPARAVALGGVIAVVAFLMTHATGHALLVPSGQMLLASFVGIAAGLATWTSARPPVAPARPSSARVAFAAAVVVVIIAYPAIGMLQGLSPATGPWGYAVGLFPEEPAGDGRSYRWTSASAILDLDVPAGRAALELPVAAPSPIRDGQPVRVTLSVGEWIRHVVLDSAEVRTIRIPLDRGRAAGPARAVVRIDVDPTFSPARERPSSGDHRVLGIQLLPPRFVE